MLRTLTAIIHLERDPRCVCVCVLPYPVGMFVCMYACRLTAIIEATGAAIYHGFLPSLVRDCVAVFTSTDNPQTLETSEFPLTFATALFSFLYHLATYEASKDTSLHALVPSTVCPASTA